LNQLATITTWQEYYTIRDIDLSSPVAILLSFPLTVYHIIANVIKLTSNPPQRILIHYIGVEKEICHLPIWKELMHLLPEIQEIVIIMIGLDFDDNVQTAHQFESGNRKLTIQLIKSLYHTLEIEKPDVIFALNAGLAAYSTWLPTLNLLGKSKVPTFFTDYSETSCILGVRLLEKLGIHVKYQTSCNPFRSPAQRPNPSLTTPTYTNGFIYGIN